MAKGIKVFFLKDVPEIARAGEVKEVSLGYARNFLMPEGLAVVGTPAMIKQAEAMRAAQAKREARAAAAVRTLATRLDGLTITLTARAGEQGRLYGSITAGDIAAGIERLLGEAIDRRQVQLEQPLRQVGTYEVPVRLGRGLSPAITVIVEAEGV